jgi:hypothetical protein
VGQGGRYEFDEADIPVLATQLQGWLAKQSSRPAKASAKVRTPKVKPSRVDQDREVWAEEGDVNLPDIRNPKILAQVRRTAREQTDRLNEQLLAAGLHISQAFDRV